MRRLRKAEIYFAVIWVLLFISSCKAGVDITETQDEYPIKTDVELTYWLEPNSNLVAVNKNINETQFAAALYEATGIKVKYIHPADNNSVRQIALVLSSGNLPDIIEWNSIDYSGGVQKAVYDGYIMRINDLIEKHSPNLKKLLNENSAVDNMLTTYDGSYYCYPFLRLDPYLLTYQGLILREDWLKELNLSVPETISEWHTVLSEFKDKKNIPAPLCLPNPNTSFMGAYGVTSGFYRQDYTVKFGEIEAGYKEFLALFRDWYAEGLLDENFGNLNGRAIDVAVTEGKAGAVFGLAGSGMGRWTDEMAGDSSFKLTAAPIPTLIKGYQPEFGHRSPEYSTLIAVITNNCKNPEIAAKFLDYGYGKEGHMLFNFGIENKSYVMEDGEPKYTDIIKKNPQNLTFGQALCLYARSPYFGPFVQDKRYMMQYYEHPEQKEAIQVWGHGDLERHMLPQLKFTPEETDELAAIMYKVNEYAGEMKLKFIFGAVSLDEFDNYVNNMKAMGLDRAIEIQNNAYKRHRDTYKMFR